MLIGAIGAGKTTLTHVLLGKNVQPRKTQSLLYYDWIVDTPGEYTENPLFYKNIMATALEVTHILFIQDATKNNSIFPPGFSTGMNKLIIGVITKCDLMDADIDRAARHLKSAIKTGPILLTSAVTYMGIRELKELIQCSSIEGMKEIVNKSQQKDQPTFYYWEDA